MDNRRVRHGEGSRRNVCHYREAAVMQILAENNSIFDNAANQFRIPVRSTVGLAPTPIDDFANGIGRIKGV